MNKYQEALENFGEHRSYINEQIHDLRTQIEELDTDAFNFYGLNDLEELVKKETPMKPIHLYENRYSCDNCAMVFDLDSKVRFVNNQYCDVCGQKLDWSDGE